MPELPEVETVRRQLSKVWKGRRIQNLECSTPSYFFITPPRTLVRRLQGRKLMDLRRVGKSLLAEFDDKSRLLLHLGMTGQLTTGAVPQDGHVHMIFHLSGGKTISFRDVRKFGKAEWIAAGKSSLRLEKLGPDALGIRGEALYASFKKRRVPIKSALLNQEILAGVGNIYADEILFAAKIRPTRPAGALTRKQCNLVALQVRSILSKAIDSGGSTINDYVQSDGEKGGFQNFHQVYGKTGLACPNCSAPILRKVINARSSHYCARCQR